jgi:uncharacterized protein with HEPN domain
MKDERLYLLHILESSKRIMEYLSVGYDAWLTDYKTQDAVIRVLSNLTESATHLNEQTKKQYPEIPWAAIKGLRNVLVHEYLGNLEYDEIWRIIQEDLPALVQSASKTLKEKYGTEF